MQHKQGLTLIELLVVVAIIGIIAAIAVPNLLQTIQRSKVNSSFGNLSSIKTAIGTYMVDYGHYPISGDFRNDRSIVVPLAVAILPEEYYNGSLKDAWGEQIMYASDRLGTQYVVVSSGTDGKTDRTSMMNVWWDEPWLYRTAGGGTRNSCRRVPYEDMAEIISEGCDLIFINGYQIGTPPS